MYQLNFSSDTNTADFFFFFNQTAQESSCHKLNNKYFVSLARKGTAVVSQIQWYDQPTLL